MAKKREYNAGILHSCGLNLRPCISRKTNIMEDTQPALPKRKFKRLHQDTCGVGRMEYDNYDDVRLACERKLAEWERLGIIPPWRPLQNNDWLFAR